MRNVLQKLILLISFTAFCFSLALSGNGKIAGVIKDNNGKAVPGATVLIGGTRLGGFAAVDGRYYVLNIPPGKYDVTITAIGFSKRTYRGVEVNSDVTTDLNVTINESAVEVEGVIVEAKRKLVDKTLTSTKTTIGSDELGNSLPISSTYELLQTAPSVFKGFIRGGKQEQTKTIVEGVDVSDEFYAAAGDQTVTGSNQAYNRINRVEESRQSVTASVNPNSISELTVNTGALGAEYSSATAGVISYSLKEGKGAINGRAYFRSSAKKLDYAGPRVYNDANIYFAERDSLIAQGKNDPTKAEKAKLYTYYNGKYDEGEVSMEGEFSLNGSLTDDLGFFLSANLRDNPNSRFANTKYRELNTQLKLNYNLTDNIKLVGFGILNDKGKLFGWKNSAYDEMSKFYLEQVSKTCGYSAIGSLKMIHFLAANTFYEVQVSNKYDYSERGFCDDNGDFIVQNDEDGDFIKFNSYDQINKYVNDNNPNVFFGNSPGFTNTIFSGIGGGKYGIAKPGLYYDNTVVNVLNAKADFTSQITYNHQLKAGINFKMSNYSKENRQNAGASGTAGRSYVEEKWDMKPIEFSAYAQDRMEYAGLVINIGLRADMWDPKAEDYANFFQPSVFQTNVYDAGTVVEPVPYRGKKIDPYWFFSPRVAISHPISDKATVYFSFVKNSQPPPASGLYSLYNYFGPSRPVTLTLQRKPYYSTNYELGTQWEVFPNISLNVNTYMKDIENYFSKQFVVAPRPGVASGIEKYYVYFTAGYANARGIELQLETLPYDVANFVKISGRLSYTYSYVKGSSIIGGGPNDKTTFDALIGDSAKYAGSLPFDDYNYFRKVETNISGSSNSLTGGYDREHRISYTLFARFPYEISLTSLGTIQSGFYWTKKFVDDRVVGRALTTAPWNIQLDLRLEKAFTLSRKLRVALFADVKNILDRMNILNYDDSSTGADLWELKGDPTGTAKRPISASDSPFYDIPREVYFGVTIDF